MHANQCTCAQSFLHKQRWVVNCWLNPTWNFKIKQVIPAWNLYVIPPAFLWEMKTALCVWVCVCMCMFGMWTYEAVDSCCHYSCTDAHYSFTDALNVPLCILHPAGSMWKTTVGNYTVSVVTLLMIMTYLEKGFSCISWLCTLIFHARG